MDAGAGTTTARERRTSLRAVPAAVLATLIALAAGLTGGIGPVRTGAGAEGMPATTTAAAVAAVLTPIADATLRAESALDSVAAATSPSTSSASGPVAVTAAAVLAVLVLLRFGTSGGPRRAVPALRARTRRDRAPPRGVLFAA